MGLEGEFGGVGLIDGRLGGRGGLGRCEGWSTFGKRLFEGGFRDCLRHGSQDGGRGEQTRLLKA